MLLPLQSLQRLRFKNVLSRTSQTAEGFQLDGRRRLLVPATLEPRFRSSQPRWTQSVNLWGAHSTPVFFYLFIFFHAASSRRSAFPRDLNSWYAVHPGSSWNRRAICFSLSDTWTRSKERSRSKPTAAGNRRSHSIHLSDVCLSSERGCLLFPLCFLLLVVFLRKWSKTLVLVRP